MGRQPWRFGHLSGADTRPEWVRVLGPSRLSRMTEGGSMVLKNVLIIDNDAGEATALARAFEAHRFPAFVYATGLEALTAVRNMKLGLVIGSITLPGENILEIFRELKALPGNEELPFMLILPKGAEYSPEEVVSYGIVDAIVRPVNVLEAVRRALGHLDLNGKPEGGDSPVDRAVRTVLSDHPDRGSTVEGKSPQLSLLEEVPEGGEKPGGGRDTEIRTASPRFHREGQVFDDPVDKLNADLKRSIRSARRNRLLIAGASLVFFGGLAWILYLGGNEQKVERSETEITEPVSVPSPAEEPTVPDSAEIIEKYEDPFGDILKKDLERREKKPETVMRSTRGTEARLREAQFSIQVGAYASEPNARKALVDLLEKGYEARIVPQKTSSGKVLHRVLVGGYPDRAAAGEALVRLASKENIEGFITRFEK